MRTTATTRHSLLSNFAGPGGAAAGPDWLRDLRRNALARFEQLGFPSTRLEEWRTTNVSPIVDTEWLPPAAGAPSSLGGLLPAAARAALGGPRLVFVDGRLVGAESTPLDDREGLWVGSLKRALEVVPERVRPHLTHWDPAEGQAFEALNAARLEDGAVVLAGPDLDGGAPVQLVFASTGGDRPTAVHPRVVVAADRGSRLQVVETHVGLGDGVYFNNAVTDLFAGDAAHVEHYRIQLEGARAFHVSGVRSHQGRDSRCVLHNLDLGGRLVRHDVLSRIDGEGADCQLNGLYLTRNEQHVDNHTVLDHMRPHGTSRELYKGILGERSRAVFNGRIVVRRPAQKTDAKQSNPNLLLSTGALANTRPQLEIYADDVKCTHGATIGRLDEEALFYLRSRGISEVDARNLMITSFAGEVLERVGVEALRGELERAVYARLPRDVRRS